MVKRYIPVFIKTGVLEKLGLKSLKDAIEIDYLGEYLSKHKDGDVYIITLDIFHPYVDYIIRQLPSMDSKDVIVFMAKPDSPLIKLFQRLAYNPFSRILGSRLSLAIAVSGKLVRQIKDVHGLDELINNARNIMAITLREPLYEYFYMIYGRLPKVLLVTLLEPGRLIRFGFVGLTGVLVNLVAIYTALTLLPPSLTRLLRIMISSIIGFETSLTWNFILHESWTFKDLELRRSLSARIKRWVKYHLASIGSLISQTLTITILTGLFNINIASSLLIGVIIGFIVNYLVGRFYTWKK